MKLKPYPKYKPSGVEWLGDVPEGWEVHPLKRVASVRYGLGQPPKESSGGLPLIRATNIDSGRILAEKLLFVDPADVPEGRNAFLKIGEIIVVRSGALTGDSAIVPSEYDGAVAGYDMVVTARDSHPEFLAWTLLSVHVRNYQFTLQSLRAAQPHLNAEDLASTIFCLAPLDAQVAIATFLDRETTKIDTLIAKQEKLIELLQEKRQTIISHAVTKGLDPTVPMKPSGLEWLGDVPEHWGIKRLKHLVSDTKAGPFGSSLTKDMYTSSGYRVYGQEQVIPADFTIGDYYIPQVIYAGLRQYEVCTGDILISCVGTFGKIAVVPEGVEPGIINPRLIRLRAAAAVTPPFLAMLLRSGPVAEQFSFLSRGGTMDVINIGTLNEIVLPLPPIEDQAAVLAFVMAEGSKIDTLIAKARQAIELQKEHRAALISAAVTGRIDVRSMVYQGVYEEKAA